MTISMGIYLFVTNLCSDTVRLDREEGETRGCRSEIAAKTVTSVKWRLSEMKKDYWQACSLSLWLQQ